MKKDIELWKARWLLNHSPLLLVTSRARGRDNVMTVAWSVPLSHVKPWIGVVISKDCFSHELISESHEFAINIPDFRLLKKVKLCGGVSGRYVDKFASFKLTREKGKEISSPLIKECFANIELRVIGSTDYGDHTLFVGEALRCVAEEGAINSPLDISRFRTVHHLGEDKFVLIKPLEGA
jgi:flavin reductase (DIM6/NTAB) family NADH-FMN oxidoreductase RutF